MWVFLMRPWIRCAAAYRTPLRFACVESGKQWSMTLPLWKIHLFCMVTHNFSPLAGVFRLCILGVLLSVLSVCAFTPTIWQNWLITDWCIKRFNKE